jgi:hypothetical protein
VFRGKYNFSFKKWNCSKFVLIIDNFNLQAKNKENIKILMKRAILFNPKAKFADVVVQSPNYTNWRSCVLVCVKIQRIFICEKLLSPVSFRAATNVSLVMRNLL